MHWRARLGLLLALASAPAAAAGESLRLDGIPDEALWSQAQVFDDFRVVVPYTLSPATHATVARLVSLPEGLAVAFVCEQPPSTPRLKPRAVRDASVPADRVNVAIDFDGDGKLAYNFMVTLGNAIADEVISNENVYNGDWDGVWQYGLHEDEQHWSVEILIPWSVAAMRESEAPTRPINVYFDRVIASRNERSATPHTSYEQPRFVSAFSRIEIARQDNAGLLAIIPYGSAQYDFVGDGVDGRAGVDLFWKPSGRFQLSAALNPDFGQVEADDLVVNFDAIEVFFSDKRPFFTENQGLFDVHTPDEGRLVYTRRIGGPRDDGEGIADIDAAVKLNGSLGGFDYGTLATVESDYADDLGRAFFVQRLMRGVGPLTLGYLGTWTDRPFFQREAQVHAVDAVWRPSADWLLSGQVLTSRIRQDFDDAGRPDVDDDGSGAWLRVFHTPDPRYQHELEITHFDRQLDFNDVGYQRRASLNELEYTATLRQTDFDEGSSLRSVSWAIEPQLRYNDRGDRLPPVLLLSRNAQTQSGGTWYNELIYAWRGYDDLISRGNGLVALEPRLESWWNYYDSPRQGNWQWRLGAWVFQEGNDGYAAQPEGIVSWFPSERLDLRLLFYPRWSRDWLIWREDTLFASYRRKQMQVDFDINWFPGNRHELRLKTQWLGIDAYDPTPYRIGAGGHLAESDDAVEPFTVNSFGVQLRYRYEFAPQRELYVVYGRGGFMLDDELGLADGHDSGIGDLIQAIPDLRDADQILVKLRWRL